MNKPYIKYKVAVWQQAHFKKDTDIEKLKQSCIDSTDIDYIIGSNDNDFVECDTLFDTVEPLTVKENNNQSTIELYDGDKLIWDNTQQ